MAERWTTEAELESAATAAAIEATWNTAGRATTLQGQGGVALAAMAFVQPDRAREKGAVVISSGRTEALPKYKEVVHDLWRDGWSVYLHDHRGQGRSAREPAVADDPQKGYVGRFDDFVDDLRTVIRTQVAPAGHRDVFLLAHSMGGAIAARLLEQPSPERELIRAAVLSSPMMMIRVPGGGVGSAIACGVAGALSGLGLGTHYLAGTGPYAAVPFDTNPFTHSVVRYDRMVAAFAAEPATRLGGPTWGWAAQACGAAKLARESAAAVRVPVKLLLAGADSVVDAAGAQAFCRGLPGGCGGDGGGPVVFDGAKHELLIESDRWRSRALDEITGFFEVQRRR